MTETIEWISVSDRLPERFQAVLVYAPQHCRSPFCGWYETRSGTWHDDREFLLDARDVTHWAAWPGGPKG